MNNFKPSQTMLNNYIQNKLSDNETEELELWLADHPEATDDMEMGVMFKQSINDKLLNHNSESNSVVSWWQNLFAKPVLIFSHALLFFSGMLILNLFANINTHNSISNPSVTMLSQMRGENEVVKLSNDKDLIIQIPVDYLSQDLYKVSIKGLTDVKFSLQKIKPEADIVSLLIPEQTLTKGNYEIILTNETSEDRFVYQIIVLPNKNN